MELMTLVRAQWDRGLAILFVLIGLAMLLVGWVGVSGAEVVVKQLPYVMSLGITGVVMVAIGAVLWVSADLRDQWRELRLVRLSLRELSGISDLATPTAAHRKA
ncbi:hypothetical protein GCM10009547_07450 [Sporichthya brevicatena]|uniref:LapA family protein n=1 Tax=Sporichthya brevicatena TaxID=171442 RepID=A0ABN1GBH3_9ACTN